jgi:hypothetical protein
MSTISPGLRQALEYHERFTKWHLFPCAWGTKWPLRGSHGHLDATNDPVELERLFSRRSRLNPALAAAPSGLVIVDTDVRNGGDETLRVLERELGPLPETPRVLSGSGDGSTHLYFLAPEGVPFRPSAGPGLDVKHQGYVLLPESLHENGRVYRHDVGAHLFETPIVDLPESWLAYLRNRPKPPALPSSGIDAANSLLGHAFAAAGWLGDALPNGRRRVRCPWLLEHSPERDGTRRGAGQDSSTVLLPSAEGRIVGGFRCLHAHCVARGLRHVLAALPAAALWAGEQKMRRLNNELALARLAARRRCTGPV